MEEIKDFINERLRNPFLASLAFFWIVLNWRIPAFLFISNLPIEARFKVIETDYTSFSRSLLFPILASIIYYYLKDKAFNYLEKDTAEYFLERKETYTDREIKLIDLEIRKASKLNELADAKARHKEIEELTTINTSLNRTLELEKETVKTKDKEITVLNKRVELLVNNVNLGFQYDLRDKKIQALVNSKSEKEIRTLGSIISNLYQEVGRVLSEDDRSDITELQRVDAGFFQITNDGELRNIELFSVGNYLLKTYLFSAKEMQGANLNFVKKTNTF